MGTELKLMHLRSFALAIAIFLSCQAGAAHAACDKGFQPRGEICVSQRISDYIACIEASGGNKSQIDHDISETLNDTATGSAKGSGSGLVVKGEGSLNLSKQGEKVLSDHLSVKYNEGAMVQCNEALKSSDAVEKKSEIYDWQKDAKRLAYIYSGNAYCDKYHKVTTQCINTSVGNYHLKNGTEDYLNSVNVTADTISVHLMHYQKSHLDQDIVAVAKIADLDSYPRLMTGNYYDGTSADNIELDCIIGECVRWSGWGWGSDRPSHAVKDKYSTQEVPVMHYMDIPVINNVDSELVLEMRRIFARLIAPDHQDTGETACRFLCSSTSCPWITDDCAKRLYDAKN